LRAHNHLRLSHSLWLRGVYGTLGDSPPAVFAAPLGFASISVYLLGDDSVGGVTQESLTD
ncbi:hypothetical protein, partial [Stenotrophomonas maltophilia]|uniref:hypothetical protein n=1 Tax=Stenotrophomonas maltophilia TaxID=40324 RepID=UPI001FA6A9F5